MKKAKGRNMSEYKEWRCENGHVMGQVARNGSNIRKLLLYRNAIDPAEAEPVEVDVMGLVEGYVADVKCSICGSVRTWVPGQEAMDRLVEMVLRARGS
jgi:hypothetical protein